MKIKINKRQQEVSLDTIKVGEIFRLDSKLFMRTECIAFVNSLGEMNSWDCVNVADGSMSFIPMSCTVKKIEAYLIVKE